MHDDVTLCAGILDRAIAHEEKGKTFYEERAATAGTSLERNVFLSLAKDEMGHRAYLLKLRRDLARTEDIATIFDEGHDQWSPREVFDTALDRMRNGHDPLPEDLEILRAAMEVEKQAFHMYREAARKVDSPMARNLFEQLASEEQAHYQILSNTHDYLESPEGWHGFVESPLLDGG